MSRLGCISVSFDEYLTVRDPFSSRFREVIVSSEHDISYVDICNVVLRWHGELGVYLMCIANDVKEFETEDGTEFRVSVPDALLSESERTWLANYLQAISSDSPAHVVEKITGWYSTNEGAVKLTVFKAPQVEYSLSIESGVGEKCEAFISANASYHYFLSGEEIEEEIDGAFYADLKERFDDFEKSYGDLDFGSGEPIFIPNEQFYG